MTSNQNTSKHVFANFSEYWHYVRFLSDSQRNIIFGSLSESEKSRIRRSYNRGGWTDLMMRNTLDTLLDEIIDYHSVDLIEIKGKVIRGKSVYVSKSLWDYVEYRLEMIDISHKQYIIGGIKAIVCKSNREVVLLVPISNKGEE